MRYTEVSVIASGDQTTVALVIETLEIASKVRPEINIPTCTCRMALLFEIIRGLGISSALLARTRC